MAYARPRSNDSESGLFDLLVLTDATGSMSSYLQALRQCLPDIIRVSSLTDCFSRIGVLAYRDYSRYMNYTSSLTEWSGWHAPGDASLSDISQSDLIAFTDQLGARLGGGAEAAKTGLARAHSVMRREATTIILFFSDQPPHLPWHVDAERHFEVEHLSNPDSYNGSGPLFIDWTSAARTLATGDRRARVFAYVDADRSMSISSYLYLCTMTGGKCIRRVGPMTGAAISDVVLSVLLSWMGLAEYDNVGPESTGSDPQRILATAYEWAESYSASAAAIRSEDDEAFASHIRTASVPCHLFKGTDIHALGEIGSVISSRRSPALVDLAKRYSADPAYRTFAMQQLNEIISANVLAITTNPVFGTLWRAVSSDRANPARGDLVAAFGLQVDKIPNGDERARMKLWLEQSYDFKAEILESIQAVPAADQFPCVYLDPTQDFTAGAGNVGGDDEQDNRDPTQFTRAELLEIGRSCDPKILRRLGKTLTRLSFAASQEDLPPHIRAASAEQVPRIPLALAWEQHGRKLWKVLLHLILPGTRISARPAALLAALSNRMGMLPLRDAADHELLAYSSQWNTLEIPETWNSSCLALLLDADSDYEKRVTGGITARPAADTAVLSIQDRQLFKTLVDYKMLEINLNTTLTARIGWAPAKTKVATGPVIICAKCGLPRSVTIMGSNGICGLCVGRPNCTCEACKIHPDHKARLHANVTPTDNEMTAAAWVECATSNCRSQYVVYNVAALKVRPKCFYCRHSGQGYKAPYVQCSQCLSRVIWPVKYRPAGMDMSKYRCPGCTTGRKTIVDYDTTAKKLSAENGLGWLIRDDGKAIKNKELFTGRSIFHFLSNSNVEGLSRFDVLPQMTSIELTVHGKLVRNVEDVIASLAGWISRRKAELGTCSLCFSDIRKSDLRSACGRKGCFSEICGSCHRAWYGLNTRGRIINLSALCCPFCRRRPTPQSVPAAIVHIGGLSDAVKDKAWIYAWCSSCGFAKPHLERVCANGAPQEVEGWLCEGCEVPEPAMATTRPCPGCGIGTEKTRGCDHVSCPCGTHWCYECGEAHPHNEIYRHMSTAHGGWFGGRDYEDDLEEEY